MNVKLVSITQSLIAEKPLTAEELIVYTARVSNPANQMNTATADKLLGYLIRNKHMSPFEQAHLGVEVVTSRAIAAQILRHWSMRFQEFSQRYAEVTEFEPVQIRRKAATNRQSSEEAFDPDLYFEVDGLFFNGPASVIIDTHIRISEALYKELLKEEVAKECARMILPLTTQTTMYMTGSVRDWIFYLAQRTDQHAQLEHRQVAQEIHKLFAQHFPNVHKAIIENNILPNYAEQEG